MYLSAEICTLKRELLKLPSCSTRPLQRADVKQRQLLAPTPQELHRTFHGTLRRRGDIHRAEDVTERVVGALILALAHNKRWARGTGNDTLRD